MYLIATDPKQRDIGVVHDCTLDLAIGGGEDDFVMELPIDTRLPSIGYGSLIYVDGTEYGGIIDDIGADTTSSVHRAVYSGRTWSGILDSKVLRPDAGKSHLVVSGEMHAVIHSLIHRMGLADLFAASMLNSGITVDYQFARYTTGFTGLRSMLASRGAKLCMSRQRGKVVLSAEPIIDYSNREFEGRKTGINVLKSGRPVNHLVCLGGGELVDRDVIDLYADIKGKVSQTQTLFGLDEREAVYDYGSVKDAQELLESGTERLRELQQTDECDISSMPGKDYGLGDIIGGRESRMGIYVTAPIDKKIVSITRRGAVVSCEAGDPSVRVTQ